MPYKSFPPIPVLFPLYIGTLILMQASAQAESLTEYDHNAVEPTLYPFVFQVVSCFQVPFSFTPYSCVLFADVIVVLFSDSSQLASDISLVRRKIMSSEYKATAVDAMCYINRSLDSFPLSLCPYNDALSQERFAQDH